MNLKCIKPYLWVGSKTDQVIDSLFMICLYSPTRTDTNESSVFRKSCRTCSPEGVLRDPHPLSRFLRAGIKMEDRRVSTACSRPLPFLPFPLVSKRVKVTSCYTKRKNELKQIFNFITIAYWRNTFSSLK